jgi:hypothetical protein
LRLLVECIPVTLLADAREKNQQKGTVMSRPSVQSNILMEESP